MTLDHIDAERAPIFYGLVSRLVTAPPLLEPLRDVPALAMVSVEAATGAFVSARSAGWAGAVRPPGHRCSRSWLSD